MQAAIKNIKTLQKLRNKDILSLTLCIFFLLSNAVAQTNRPNSNKFIPDTTINFVLKLLNPASIRKVIGSQAGKMIQDEKPTRVQLTNRSGKEYLILYHSSGSNVNSFSEFEVGLIESPDKSFKPSKFGIFFTECGIHLGMAIDSLIALKGNQYLKTAINTQTVLTYKIEENEKDGKSDILGRYNMPEYEAEYHFKNSRLVKYIFGFPNP
jgi:hypothetical protein